MPIERPGKRPATLRLRGFRRRRQANADLLLTPLIDVLVVLVLFLLVHFRATGELTCLCPSIELPWANQAHGELERSPIIRISTRAIDIEGVKVGGSKEVLEDLDVRIPELTDKLQEMRKIDEMMHPGRRFQGRAIIGAAKQVDFRLIRKVMFAAAEAGYVEFNYAVSSPWPGVDGADQI